MTFNLFASVYRDFATILNNRISDHALELNTRSKLFTVDASSFEEAQEMFLESDVCRSFCNDNPNRTTAVLLSQSGKSFLWRCCSAFPCRCFCNDRV